MTPNILKSHVGGGAGYTPPTHPITASQISDGSNNSNTDSMLSSDKMDGGHAAKSMERGTNTAMKGATDMTEGVHESTKWTVCLQPGPF